MLINRIHRRKRIFCLTTVLEQQTLLQELAKFCPFPRQQLQSEAIILNSAKTFNVLGRMHKDSIRFPTVSDIFNLITFWRSDNRTCFILVAERGKCSIDATNSSYRRYQILSHFFYFLNTKTGPICTIMGFNNPKTVCSTHINPQTFCYLLNVLSCFSYTSSVVLPVTV